MPAPLTELSTPDLWTGAAQALSLILLAEMGDKSQIVCMTLGSRFHPLPVWAGAAVAFALLNTLAVAVGAALAGWLPPLLLSSASAILFLWFGVQALRGGGEEEEDEEEKGKDRGAFLTTLSMIFLAEMGDKTQLSVAALAAQHPALAVWAGATLALTVTSGLGVLAGQALLRVLPVQRVKQGAGALFIVFGLWAAWDALASLG